jgi:hypothetical protein
LIRKERRCDEMRRREEDGVMEREDEEYLFLLVLL